MRPAPFNKRRQVHDIPGENVGNGAQVTIHLTGFLLLQDSIHATASTGLPFPSVSISIPFHDILLFHQDSLPVTYVNPVLMM